VRDYVGIEGVRQARVEAGRGDEIDAEMWGGDLAIGKSTRIETMATYGHLAAWSSSSRQPRPRHLPPASQNQNLATGVQPDRQFLFPHVIPSSLPRIWRRIGRRNRTPSHLERPSSPRPSNGSRSSFLHRRSALLVRHVATAVVFSRLDRCLFLWSSRGQIW
jgi:hypothetical protein